MKELEALDGSKMSRNVLAFTCLANTTLVLRRTAAMLTLTSEEVAHALQILEHAEMDIELPPICTFLYDVAGSSFLKTLARPPLQIPLDVPYNKSSNH